MRSREASAARIDRSVTALACSGVASGGGERLAICPTTSSSCLHQRTKSPAVSSVASRMSANCAPSHQAWTAPASAGSAPEEASMRARDSRSWIRCETPSCARRHWPSLDAGATGSPIDWALSRGS